MAAPPRPRRHEFAVFTPITTRWIDNDVYGHVNNAVYFHYFDSAINDFLIQQARMDILNGEVVGFIVRSSCDYFSPVAYPMPLEVGIAVTHLGRSSVTYSAGLFVAGEPLASALGTMVHVFVNRRENRSVPMPADIRAALQRIHRVPGANP